MNNVNDEELARLLAESMAAHDGDVDAERALALALSAGRSVRRWPTAVAVAAAVVLACVGGVLAAGRLDQPSTRPSDIANFPSLDNGTSGTALATTTRQNFLLALAASRTTLAALPVPSGSTPLPGRPSGWPGGGETIGPSDWRLTRTAWWSTSLSVEQVAAFLRSHAPAGMRHPQGEDVIGGGTSDGIETTEYDLISPADPAAFTGPDLLVQFRAVGDRTVLRADTFLAARYAVPSSYRIRDHVIAVRIERSGFRRTTAPYAARPFAPVQLTYPADAPQIRQLLTSFNGLSGSVTQEGFLSCPFPGDPPPSKTVTFYTAGEYGASRGTVVVHMELGCWAQVHVTVNGTPLPVTLDPGNWSQLVDHIANNAK